MRGQLRGCLWLSLLLIAAETLAADDAMWKAGTARAVITPERLMWLAGYGGRDRPAEGKVHDLWVKVLALEDARGKRAVVVTTDLLGFSKVMVEDICAALKKSSGLERSDVMLTSSHTHCGPVVRESLLDYYPLDERQSALIAEYSRTLEKKIVAAVTEALANLQPAQLSAADGMATFAVNRRNNREDQVAEILKRGDNLKGPVDHSVPVLAVRTNDGRILAVVFGYACHNTTLNFYQWCGDYAGFAQAALERKHPGCQAMFHAGCGADQNPLPRRSLALAQKYGSELADAVETALAAPMRPIKPRLDTAFEFVTLDFEGNPAMDDLQAARRAGGIRGRWAARMLARLEKGERFEKTYPYAVEVWKLGADQCWISLAGEAVADYALRFKKELGPHTWITAYAHDLVAYIPSRRVWNEGGYEGGALYEYMLPADRWSADVEGRIATTVTRLVDKLGR